ncbi:hypothetical protein [Streptomyces sp. NPDC058291]|uniref:hypothetical protein n=1 Tax=Streptomyces sp. NPDC058291 TaxID=3346427 RepID=UPI0036E49087
MHPLMLCARRIRQKCSSRCTRPVAAGGPNDGRGPNGRRRTGRPQGTGRPEENRTTTGDRTAGGEPNHCGGPNDHRGRNGCTGAEPPQGIQQIKCDLVVVPDEAAPLLRADELDRRLFNVADLIEMGYDDAKSAAVPLIAAYAQSKSHFFVEPTAPAAAGSPAGSRTSTAPR